MGLTSPVPRLRLNDEVRSFRGEAARVVEVRQVTEPGKSHRIRVVWTNELLNPDNREYYEEVFELVGHPE